MELGNRGCDPKSLKNGEVCGSLELFRGSLNQHNAPSPPGNDGPKYLSIRK
jgi:hypothetical protein